MPETMARSKNLRNTHGRARQIATRVAAAHTVHHAEHPIANTLTHFPWGDFLCFQGVFDPQAENTLRGQLHLHYPFCLHNVGIKSWRHNRFITNSGLVLFSKYPVLDARFVPFEHSSGRERFVSKGVLMAKVRECGCICQLCGVNIRSFVVNVTFLTHFPLPSLRIPSASTKRKITINFNPPLSSLFTALSP